MKKPNEVKPARMGSYGQFTILAAILVAVAMTTQATIWTVSNNPDSPGQFTNLQTAIDSAGFYDTIMVAGSGSSYGDITLEKPLVLVGAGYNNPYGSNTTVSNIYLNRVNLYISSSDTKIIGFIISNEIRLDGIFSGGVDSTQTIDNIVVERCQITYFWFGRGVSSWQTFNNDTIRNCLISNYISPAYYHDYAGYYTYIYLSNIYIHNNIFNGAYVVDPSDHSSHLADYSTTYLKNNLFINRITNCFINIHNMIIENNIFYAAEPQGGTNCVYNNNLTFMCFDNDIPGAGNLGSGNIVDANPMFVDYPLEGGALDYSYDFHLLPGSPAINAGTDGTDIGIYGGMLPYEVGANPYFPQMMEITLPSGSSVPAGGTLNVHFKAKKQD